MEDVVLLVSLWEGSPNVIKEAMACNCPTVATDVKDIAWLFGKTPGYYLCSFDPVDVAAKINMALKFSEKNGRTKGRDKIIELGLDSETIARQIISEYESVLEKMQNKIKVTTIIGTRPQFIKAATVSRAIVMYNDSATTSITETIIHTSQHFDNNMSEVFFRELEIPKPGYNLGIGGGSHGQNTGRMIENPDYQGTFI